MADIKLTDQQVADLITTLRGDGSLDSKVQFVTTVKSGIKQHNVPEASIPLLFEGLRTASTSQHAALVNAGFTALNHLLTRLSRQEPKHLAKEANRTLPLVIEKLGDQKDKFRSLANHSLITLFAVAPADVERFIRTTAMGGKNPRAKEAAMSWLLQMHNEQGLPFRAYVPTLMELLEDADGMVRDAAKTTVIELFRTAPNTAKSDLKRQLKNFKVRPAIEQAIVKELAPSSGRPITPAAEAAPAPVVAAPAPAAASRPAGLSASVSSLSDRPTTPSVDSKPENLDPIFVNTNRELDDIFKEMAWFFEGRETEQNWLKREEYIGKLRRLNVGNAPNDFAETFLSGLRGMLDGIIKSITSLRTSLSKEGCALVQDMAATFGPAMDPMVELLMQTLIKLSAGTKKISSQLANVTVDIILSRVSYTPRLMQHIWGAFQDKNVAPRTYATGWLKTILKKEAQHKGHVEHTGGVDLMEKCLRKGLGDANPAVREKTRSAYWAFAAVWPARAEAIMEDLDGTAQKLLNKDPNNPNGPKKGEPAARPGLGLSKSTMGTSKPSLRETMMAQRKANLATKNIPPRPGSAMSHFSPVKTTSGASTSTTKPSTTRTRPESSISVNAGGMSGAPMRPTRKRGDIPARPATAGPYSVRGGQSSTELGSPESTRSKNVTPKRKETTPRRTGPRTRPGHMSHASESSLPSPSATRSAAKPAASPRVSPAKLKQSQSHLLPFSSPARANESFSIVVPSVSSRKTSPAPEERLESPTSEPVPEPETIPEPEPMATGPEPLAAEPEPVVAELISAPGTPAPPQVPVLQVYEDPFVEEQQPAPQPTFSVPVLEDKPVNADAANLPNANGQLSMSGDGRESPDKFKQSLRLLDSGIARIQSRTLDVHGFRKLQSLLRESKGVITDDKFEALLVGLFEFLEDHLPAVPPEKAQDIKAQILATIKLLLRKERDNFHPHVSKGLESILETRSAYETRAHIVSGLEVLADELVTIGDGSEMVVVLTKRLEGCDGAAAEDNRILGTGLHVLRSMLDKRSDFVPSEPELGQLTNLASCCLNSADSGVRMDAVQLCVAIHSRVGEAAFWAALKDVKDDPKSLITYYIVKRQREQGSVPVA